MGIAALRSFGSLAFAGAAFVLAPAAHAQSDPTEELPSVGSAGLIDAAKDCSDANDGATVDLALLGERGWTELTITDDEGEELDLPVHFFNRAEGDPLIVVPLAEGAPAVCVATGIVAEGAAAVPAIQTAFADAFGEGMVQGEQAVYNHNGKMIATNFEEDEEQGFVAQIAVLEQQSGD